MKKFEKFLEEELSKKERVALLNALGLTNDLEQEKSMKQRIDDIDSLLDDWKKESEG